MKEEIRYSNPTALTNSQDYRCLITSLKQRYLSARLKAAQSVSRELLQFYWSVGHDIYERQWENTYGSAFYKTLSQDLRRELPDVKGLSEINLRYMTQFYSMYSQVITILPQVAEEFKASNLPQLADDLTIEQILFSIPWDHHRRIIDKCKDNVQKALFYVQMTYQNQWGRAHILESTKESPCQRRK